MVCVLRMLIRRLSICFFFKRRIISVYFEFISHSRIIARRDESRHWRRLEDLQSSLVNFLTASETTLGPEERLYEYLEESR